MSAVTGRTIVKSTSGFDFIGLAAVLVTIAFWSSAFVVIRACLGPLTPVELSTARYVPAGLIALAYLIVKRPIPLKSDFIRLVIAAVLFIATYSVLLNIGETTVMAGPASFILNTMPVFTALIAMVALGERFGRWGWIGTAISFGGVALIAASSADGFKLDANALLIVGAAICAAIASVIQKPILGRMPALSVTAWILFIGSLPLFPVIPSTIHALGAAPATVGLNVAYLVIFPTVIAYVTWAIALKRFSVARATNFLYGVPPLATLIGFVWLGEAPNALGAFGGIMAIAGVVVVNLMRKR